MNYRRPTKMAEKGRTCEAKGCHVILSVYNMTAICSACFENIPLAERPYRYGDGF